MKLKKILSLALALFLTVGSINYVIALEQASDEEISQEVVTTSTESTTVQNYTVLSGTSLGNTYHRLNKETVTDETGFEYLKLTPTTQTLVPKVDRYSINMDVGEYNYMKVMYKTTVDNSVPFFNVMNGTGITLLEGFKPTPANEWVSAIIAINTTDSAVLNQYHFSVFGETTTANNLQGEEFCLGYIGFFKYYWDAVDYQSDISGTILATEGLGRPYCIDSNVLSINYDKLYGADNSFAFEFDNEVNALKAIVGGNSANAKIQFNASELTGIPFIKDEYSFVKVRYKYNITYDEREHIASMREGYTTNSTLHHLYDVPTSMNNVWNEDIAEIIWDTASEGYDTLTFVPMNGGGIFGGDYIYIDYIAFFADRYDAEYYNAQENDSIVLTSLDFLAANSKPFDPDNILIIGNTLESDNSLKTTFNMTAKTGKMQFDVSAISGKSLNKDKFKYFKIRYKHNLSNYNRLYSALREGYSADATLHKLFAIGDKNIWHEKIVEIDWGTSSDKNNIFTFHPIRNYENYEGNDYAYSGENFYIDYIGFFQTEIDAENFEISDSIYRDSHGKTFEKSSKIITNTLKAGSLHSVDDIDYFEFIPEKTGYYTFESIGNTDTFFRLFNKYKDNIQYSENISEENANFRITEYLYANNSYYFTINSNTGSVGYYNVSVNYNVPEVIIGFGNENYTVPNDGRLIVPIELSNLPSQKVVTSMEFTVRYDTRVFDFVSYNYDNSSGYFDSTYTPSVSKTIENTYDGLLYFRVPQSSISQSGTIFELVFQIIPDNFSTSNISLENVKLCETNSGCEFVLDTTVENTAIDKEAQNIYNGNTNLDNIAYLNTSDDSVLFDELEAATIDTAYYGDINADGAMTVSDLAWVKRKIDSKEINILDFIILDVIDAQKLSMMSAFNYIIKYSFSSEKLYPAILKADGTYEKNDFITSLKIFEPLERITTYQAAIDAKTRTEYDGMASHNPDIDWYSCNADNQNTYVIISDIPLRINLFESTKTVSIYNCSDFVLDSGLALTSISATTVSDGEYTYVFNIADMFDNDSEEDDYIISIEAKEIEKTGAYSISCCSMIESADNFGNEFNNAVLIENDCVISGKFDDIDDYDYFKFTPSVSGYYTFITYGEYDTFFRLFDEHQNNIQYADNSSESNLNFCISEYLYADNEYYFTISNTKETIGEYIFSLKYIPPNTKINFVEQALNIPSTGSFYVPIKFSGLTEQSSISTMEFNIVYDKNVLQPTNSFYLNEDYIESGDVLYTIVDTSTDEGIIRVKVLECNINQTDIVFEFEFSCIDSSTSSSNLRIENTRLYEKHSGFLFIMDCNVENILLNINPEGSEASLLSEHNFNDYIQCQYNNPEDEATLFEEVELTVENARYCDIYPDGFTNVTDLGCLKTKFNADKLSILEFAIMNAIDSYSVDILTAYNYITNYAFSGGMKIPATTACYCEECKENINKANISCCGDPLTSNDDTKICNCQTYEKNADDPGKVFDKIEFNSNIGSIPREINTKNQRIVGKMATRIFDVDWYYCPKSQYDEIYVISSEIPLNIQAFPDNNSISMISNRYNITVTAPFETIQSTGKYNYVINMSEVSESLTIDSNTLTKNIPDNILIKIQATYIDQTGLYSIFENIKDGSVYTVKNIDKEKYLSVKNGRDLPLNLKECDIIIENEITGTNNNNSQRMRIHYNASGEYYTIAPVCSFNGYFRVLDVYGGLSKVGNRLCLYMDNGKEEKRIEFEYSPEGYYTIKYKDSIYVLDVNSSNSVIINENNGLNTQKWLLFEDEYYNSKEKAYKSYSWGWPVSSKFLTSTYGQRRLENESTPRIHSGLDISANKEIVHCPTDARYCVSGFDSNSNCGYYLIVETNDKAYQTNTNLKLLFQHLKSDPKYNYPELRSKTTVDNYITKGSEIAITGDSGTPGKAHLHYTVISDGSNVFVDTNGDNSIDGYIKRTYSNTENPLSFYSNYDSFTYPVDSSAQLSSDTTDEYISYDILSNKYLALANHVAFLEGTFSDNCSSFIDAYIENQRSTMSTDLPVMYYLVINMQLSRSDLETYFTLSGAGNVSENLINGLLTKNEDEAKMLLKSPYAFYNNGNLYNVYELYDKSLNNSLDFNIISELYYDVWTNIYNHIMNTQDSSQIYTGEIIEFVTDNYHSYTE